MSTLRILCGSVGVLICSVSLAQPRYTKIDLGFQFRAESLNDRGEVAGFDSDDSSRAVVWRNGIQVQLWRALDGASSSARDISNLSTVVGGSYSPPFDGHAFKMRSDGTLTYLEPPDFLSSSARAINDLGWTLGEVSSDYSVYGVLWDPDGRMSLLDRLGADPPFTLPNDLNNHNVAVGTSDDATYVPYPVAWIPGQPLLILHEPSIPKAINDLNQIVIYGSGPLLWEDGIITPLPDPDVLSSGSANDINNLSVIVGGVTYADGWHAAIWIDQEVYSLNDLIIAPPDPNRRAESGRAINDAGQIIVTGVDLSMGYEDFSWLLTPIDFDLSDVIPGQAGVINKLIISDAPANTRVRVIYGTQEGGQPLLGCLGGTLLIQDPAHVVTINTDANGEATVQVKVPLAAQGREFVLQAFVEDRCLVSNLVRVRFD